MECNKDEAIRAKDIAVRKFTEKDFPGAKKFALKAQSLYPGLEDISQMLTTLDVHISAENKVAGEKDLYGILGVNPLADDETIKRQYRKLVLQLHPDKNKSIGADGAFLFVTEAFNVLSDKAKRFAYNTRRHVKIAQKVLVPSQSGVPGSSHKPPSGKTVDQKVPSGGSQQKVPSQSGSPLPSGGVNGNRKRPGPTPSRGKSQKGGTEKVSPQVQSFFTKGDTFWTLCARCKMQFEYMRVYRSQTLKCPSCRECFVAVEIPPPSNLAPIGADKHPWESSSNSEPHVFGVNNLFGGGVSARWSPLSGTTTYGSMSTSAPHARPTIESQLAKESLKRERDEAHAVGKGPSKKIRETNGKLVRNYGSGLSQPGLGNIDTGIGNVFQGYTVKGNNINRELLAVDVKKMVSEKALVDIHNKLRNWKLASAERASAQEKAKVKAIERKKSILAKSMQEPSHNNSGKVEQKAPEFSVPDPDFHVFDYDRLENCFKENQVWAAYDNDDGMPRFYALIHEVALLGPFKLKLSWLNSRSNTEFSPTLDWVGRGFKKTCGDFWVGKHETNQFLNSFSHQVKWDKGPRGVIRIYPQEGQIWALHRNWSPDWSLDTSEKVRHAYEMVEVVQDYKDEEGVYVAPIIKATGFRTVYNKQVDPKVVKLIPKEEMFRFSHQVPHHILTGGEKPNAPKGSVELDPAATPAHLLHVTMATNEEQEQSREHQ